MQYLFTAILIAGILAIITAAICFFKKKYMPTNLFGIIAIILLATGGIGLAVSMNIDTYTQFNNGDNVARISMKHLNANNYEVVIKLAGQPSQEYFVNGSAVQLTARILDNNRYRMEELSGVESSSDDNVQTVYELTEHKGIDVADWFKTNKLSTLLLPLAKTTTYLVSIQNGELVMRSKVKLQRVPVPDKPKVEKQPYHPNR